MAVLQDQKKVITVTTVLKGHILPRICAITLPQDPDLIAKVVTALKAGIRWIQYRQKDKSRRDLYNEALSIHRLTKKHHALLTINDYIDIALAIGAEGIHLGQEDIPLRDVKGIVPKSMIVGLSTHSVEEALEAEKEGADYIGFGPVFNTSTKDAGSPRGVVMTNSVSQRILIPLIAIGGINRSNIASLLNADSKIMGVAVSSGIFTGDIEENSKVLIDRIKNIRED